LRWIVKRNKIRKTAIAHIHAAGKEYAAIVSAITGKTVNFLHVISRRT
jgi:hypothetical protein